MNDIKPGDKVRINEGLLEGQIGYVTGVDREDNKVYIDIEGENSISNDLAFHPEVLVNGNEDHESLAHLKKLYPDFLSSLNYRFRVTTYVDGIMYVSAIPMTSLMLVEVLKTPPAGIHAVEFMLAKDDPSRGLAWKILWTV